MFLLTRIHSLKFEWFLIADTSQSIPTQYFIPTPATGSTFICLRYYNRSRHRQPFQANEHSLAIIHHLMVGLTSF